MSPACRRLCVLLLIGAAASARAASPTNLVLIGWDGAARWDVQALLTQGQLPNLARLIQEGGFAATQVTTGATETKPGWAEILTGRSADGLGIEDNAQYRPIPAGATVLEILKKRFPGTAAVFLTAKINNLAARGPHVFCVNCATRVPPGFEKTWFWDKEKIVAGTPTYGDLPRRWVPREGEPYYLTVKALDEYQNALGPADKVGERSLAALDRFHGARFAAFFHFEDPDEKGHIHKEGSPEYFQALRDDDAWLGKIVDKLRSLGVYGQTAVFVTTDHSFDRGRISHRFAPDTFLATNVPRPLHAGDRKDVAPTILDALGVDASALQPRMDGRSLFSAPR